jgi:hypothetical protein
VQKNRERKKAITVWRRLMYPQRYPKIAKFCFVLPVEEEDVKGMYSILSLLLHSDQKIRSLIISPADFKEALGV